MNHTNLYRVLALALLAGFAAHHYGLTHKPAGVEEYQARIRAAADAVPGHIGSWVAQEVPVPARANTLLRPNIVLSRRYTNVENGQTAGFMLVHCSEAHSMAGHYPLRCYPAEGWVLESARPRDWSVGDLLIGGTEYTFTIEEVGRTRSIVVANCLLLPGGKVLRDMNSMAQSLAGVGSQSAGAGQLQIQFDATVPQDQRDKTIGELIGGYRGAIGAILSDALPPPSSMPAVSAHE